MLSAVGLIPFRLLAPNRPPKKELLELSNSYLKKGRRANATRTRWGTGFFRLGVGRVGGMERNTLRMAPTKFLGFPDGLVCQKFAKTGRKKGQKEGFAKPCQKKQAPTEPVSA